MRRGFTLTELVVMTAILAILSLALAMVVSLSLNYYRASQSRTTAENNVRMAASVITTEFRQAAHWGSETTALIMPTAANSTGSPAHELQFQELVPDLSLVQLPAGALDSDPSRYQLISYSLNPTATAMLRTVTPYTASGSLGTTSAPAVVVQSVNGRIDLSTVFWSSNAVTMVLTAQEGGYTDASQVYHPSVQDSITCNQVSALYH